MRAIVELFIRCIHLIAAIVWFGGVVFATLIAMLIVQQDLLEVVNDSCTPPVWERVCQLSMN